MGFDWKDHLQDGEELRWTGAPMATKLTENPLNLRLIVFPWVAMLAVVFLGTRDADSLSEGLLEISFPLGLALALAIYLTLAARGEWQDRGMHQYAVTNRRVLMWHSADEHLYQTQLEGKTRGVLVSNAVSVGCRWSWVPIMAYFGGLPRVVGRRPISNVSRGIVMYSFKDPKSALMAIRQAAEAL